MAHPEKRKKYREKGGYYVLVLLYVCMYVAPQVAFVVRQTRKHPKYIITNRRLAIHRN
jgi:hypothetical protein